MADSAALVDRDWTHTGEQPIGVCGHDLVLTWLVKGVHRLRSPQARRRLAHTLGALERDGWQDRHQGIEFTVDDPSAVFGGALSHDPRAPDGRLIGNKMAGL